MRTLADGIKLTDQVVLQIVVRAAEEVAGVHVKRPRRHLDVDIAGGEARVALDVTMEYGTVLPDAARAVQDKVAGAIGAMCGVQVRSIDVNVEGVA